jgi:hypothetical protein
MVRIGATCTLAATVFAVSLLAPAPSAQAGSFTASVFATGAGVNATQPDSITYAGGHVFIVYSNGASSSLPPGTAGFSTIAEYDLSGTVLKTYSLGGDVDGLRYNASTNQLWALQNQDGNSALTLIDVSTGHMTPYSYTTTSTTRGYDDVQFVGGKAFLSVTNPPTPSDPNAPVIVQATLGNGTVSVSPVLTFGATGTNTATGHTGQIIANDPDSLNLRPNGSLMLTSEADGSLITVTNPGTGTQSVRFVSLIDSKGNSLTGLDDAISPSNSDQRLLVADTANNTVYALQGPFQVTGTYASISSTGSVSSVDLTTGVSTSITDGLFAANASPHGLLFVASVPEPSTLVLSAISVLAGLIGIGLRRKRADGV